MNALLAIEPRARPFAKCARGIATCIPGAELTEVVDENTYKGGIAVRLGPVALSLVGQARFEGIDHANRKARVKAQPPSGLRNNKFVERAISKEL